MQLLLQCLYLFASLSQFHSIVQRITCCFHIFLCQRLTLIFSLVIVDPQILVWVGKALGGRSRGRRWVGRVSDQLLGRGQLDKGTQTSASQGSGNERQKAGRRRRDFKSSDMTYEKAPLVSLSPTHSRFLHLVSTLSVGAVSFPGNLWHLSCHSHFTSSFLCLTPKRRTGGRRANSSIQNL